MEYNDTPVWFTYAPDGTPISMTTGGQTYYYTTNLQGDVVAIVDTDGAPLVYYYYDAWGFDGPPSNQTNPLSIAMLNPLRYRGYVYDVETGLYYLQSRYYDPEIGRFINADAFTSTGQGFTGNNMFAYCGNNPVNRLDPSGNFFKTIGNWFNEKVDQAERELNKLVDFITNDNEQAVLDAKDLAFYKGVPVIKLPFMGNSAFSFGIMFMGSDGDKNLVKHEYGHTVHLRQIGLSNYIKKVAVPSVISYWNPNRKGDYYSQPWEYIADYFGKVNRVDHVYEANAHRNATWYWFYTLLPH